MSKDKLDSILKQLIPTTTKELQSFLGIANYYRKFVTGYLGIVKDLTKLIKKETTFEQTKEQEIAFNKLKEEFTKEPILQIFDLERYIIIETDVSDFAIGAILLQKDDKG